MPDSLRLLHKQALQKYLAIGLKHLSWNGAELPGLHKSGREVLRKISFGEIQLEDRHIFTGICRDVTECKQIHSERLHLAAIVDSSDDAIISRTLDGVITSWNRGAEKIYGSSASEVVGKPISLLAPPELANQIPQIRAGLKRGKRIEHYETVRLRKDGPRIQLSLRVSPLPDDTAQMVGASVVGRDITDRKNAEAQLQTALAQVISGFLPICMSCKKILQ